MTYKRTPNSFFRWSDKIDAKKDKNGHIFRSFKDTCETCKTPITFIIYDKEENDAGISR